METTYYVVFLSDAANGYGYTQGDAHYSDKSELRDDVCEWLDGCGFQNPAVEIHVTMGDRTRRMSRWIRA